MDIAIEKSYVDEILKYLSEIESYDEKISDVLLGAEGFDKDTLAEDLPNSIDLELEQQTEYNSNVKSKLAQLQAKLKTIESSASAPVGQSGASCELKLPVLQCGHFSGEGTQNLEFKTFMSQFNNVVGFRSNISDSTKFTYLKT